MKTSVERNGSRREPKTPNQIDGAHEPLGPNTMATRRFVRSPEQKCRIVSLPQGGFDQKVELPEGRLNV
jgi:hypothetical protein